MHPLPCLAAAAAALVSIASAQNTLVVTYAENPESLNSTLSHTSVFDFNDLSTGTHTEVSWDGVGTFNQITVNGADRFGGANNSNYSVQGTGGVASTTLLFAQPHAYFGFWWSAGDGQNLLEFYSGDSLVARFTTDSLLKKIASSPDYYGNPNPGPFFGQNPDEPYAFVNFFGMEGTTWDRIVFSNTSGSGFESDNYTDRAQAYGHYAGEDPSNLPGVAVATVSGDTVTVIPEPSSALLAAPALLLAVRGRRRRNPAV